MSGLNLLPVMMVGLLGGVHCVGMCGGIVGALSMSGRGSHSARSVRFPVAVVVQPAVSSGLRGGLDGALRVVLYNLGRIGSYAVAGAFAGGLAGGTRTLAQLSSLQVAGYWLANLMLVALGLYLMNVWHGLSVLERGGQVVWRQVQPLIKPLLPMDSPLKALALGGLWGWVPCGMVYSVLLTALLTGSAVSGALVMLAFGLGTLPTLLTIGIFGQRVQGWTRQTQVRLTAGLLVLGFGLLGFVRVAHGMSAGWLDLFCITPSLHG